RDRRPGVVRDVPGLVPLRDVVVRAEERPDAVLLARLGERAPVLPRDAFLPLDHERELHRASVSVSIPKSGVHFRRSPVIRTTNYWRESAGRGLTSGPDPSPRCAQPARNRGETE